MPIKRVTISMPEKLARRLKKAAGKEPVSAWLTKLVEERLDDAELERLWEEHYAGLELTQGEIRRGDELFKRLTKPRGRRAAS